MIGEFVKAIIARHQRQNGVQHIFSVCETALTVDDFADPTFMLPLVAWHADEIYKYSLNEGGFGIKMSQDKDSYLGASVNLDHVHRSYSEVLMFITDAIEDSIRYLPECTANPGAKKIDSLVASFLAQNKFEQKVRPSSGSQSSTPS